MSFSFRPVELQATQCVANGTQRAPSMPLELNPLFTDLVQIMNGYNGFNNGKQRKQRIDIPKSGSFGNARVTQTDAFTG